ncbi:MAG: DEAD/DEAH box helicase, partial [Phycisphaeraceae bacterium]|nr:DEAD/DEAH box helicase [Phycisphaeraceae bacterium]
MSETPVSITVAGDIRIPLADISPEQVRHLRRGATITVRERQHAYGEMRWVETPRDLSVLEESHIVLPRGMLGEVQRVLGRVDVAGATARSEHGYTLRVGLRPHQREIAEIAKWKVQGIITAATGAGKTGAAFAIAAAVGQRMLVLVPTVALADQWRTEAMRFLGVEAATSTGGEWTDAPIVIATPTTATNHAERLGAYGLLVVDEVQGFATELRVALIRQIPARWRIGMTATLPRDHRGDVLRRVFGPVLYRYGVADGLASGTLVDPIYEQVETSFTAAYTGPEDWQALLEALVTDPSRNTQIADIVESRCADVCTLVLSSRIAHLETLRDI